MDLNNITFRNANVKDVFSIMEIENSSFSRLICESEDTFMERISIFSDGFRIMEHNNEVIGYICSEIWNYKERVEIDSFTLGHSIKEKHNSKGKEVYISSMGLLSAYRGQGLGRLMFEDFMRYIKGMFPNIQSAILIVSEKWISARKIYESNGYKNIKTLKNFFIYQNNHKHYEDGIVMRKVLDKY